MGDFKEDEKRQSYSCARSAPITSKAVLPVRSIPRLPPLHTALNSQDTRYVPGSTNATWVNFSLSAPFDRRAIVRSIQWDTSTAWPGSRSILLRSEERR